MGSAVRTLRLTIIAGLLLVPGLWPADAPAAAASNNPPTLNQRVAALEGKMVQLQAQVATLKATVQAQGTRISGLQGLLAALQANPALALGRYVSVTSSPLNGVKGPNIVFSGANLHIVSGSGSTDDGSYDESTHTHDPAMLTGLGNLIVGYDEEPAYGPVERCGSHNLVLGTRNAFTAFGGYVGGDANTISGGWASVRGGAYNTATGICAGVSGGDGNYASGWYSSVSGGSVNGASGSSACVSGGTQNDASGDAASVSGGSQNGATSDCASVSGGHKNMATNSYSSVSGGFEGIASGYEASVSGGFNNHAAGDDSSVSGGFYLALDAVYGWAAGIPGDPVAPPFDQPWFRATLPSGTP